VAVLNLEQEPVIPQTPPRRHTRALQPKTQSRIQRAGAAAVHTIYWRRSRHTRVQTLLASLPLSPHSARPCRWPLCFSFPSLPPLPSFSTAAPRSSWFNGSGPAAGGGGLPHALHVRHARQHDQARPLLQHRGWPFKDLAFPLFFSTVLSFSGFSVRRLVAGVRLIVDSVL
jgi:hypothetical protein